MEERSREYALQRMDEWYAERFRTFYTENAANHIIELIISDFKDKSVNGEDLEEIINISLSRKEQLKVAQIHFSVAYSNLEWHMERAPNTEDTTEAIREYFEPFRDSYNKLKLFIDNVREKSNEDFTRDLSQEDIDNAFKSTFGNCSKFTDFYIDNCKCALNLLEFYVSKGDIPKSTFDISKRLMVSIEKHYPTLMNIVFGDLK